MARKDKIQDLAYSWIGTPYRYQCRLKGQGVDCLGLIVAIWEELNKKELPEKLPPYSASWLGHYKKEDLYNNMMRYLGEVPIEKATTGDVILFRMNPRQPAKHCAILTDKGSKMIHAYEKHGVILENYSLAWRNRTAKAFRFNKKK